VGVLLASNDLNGALSLTDQLLAKYPGNLPAQASRIEVLMRMNKPDQAKGAVDTLLAKNPGISVGIYYRALLLARSGDNKNAWRVAQSLSQDFLRSQPGVALTTSQMASGSGNAETGPAILASAIARFPQNAQLRLRLAQIRLGQNDTNGALGA